MQKAWVSCGISTILAIVFAALYFFSPKTLVKETVHQTTQILTNIVTNDVIKEVPKEIEKVVKIPAEIPPEYITAKSIYDKMTSAPPVNPKQMLFNMQDVTVVLSMDEDTKKVITEDDVRAKFELTLRRNMFPINPSSLHTLHLDIAGFFEQIGLFCFSLSTYVTEQQYVFRNGECKLEIVKVWEEAAFFGTVGKSIATEGVNTRVEKSAEYFANEFLSANPKK